MLPIILLILCIIQFIIVIVLIIRMKNIKTNIKHSCIILDDIASGNFDRRILVNEKDITAELCYKINEIVIESKGEFVKLTRSEKAYRQLITSLSHDMRTPLSSLVGYLEAVNSNIVTGYEKDGYIGAALTKSYNLKDYIETLFEWLKLESGEQIFYFENLDICEITRNIMSDWIPKLENQNLTYEINIPEKVIELKIDNSSYHRIINNLVQNIILHSNATKLMLKLSMVNSNVEIILSDNGQGISKKDLPHIFDRLYKCNDARGVKGNGLGLSIVKELIKVHNGQISVVSVLNSGTSFKILLPCE